MIKSSPVDTMDASVCCCCWGAAFPFFSGSVTTSRPPFNLSFSSAGVVLLDVLSPTSSSSWCSFNDICSAKNVQNGTSNSGSSKYFFFLSANAPIFIVSDKGAGVWFSLENHKEKTYVSMKCSHLKNKSMA